MEITNSEVRLRDQAHQFVTAENQFWTAQGSNLGEWELTQLEARVDHDAKLLVKAAIAVAIERLRKA